MLLGSHRNYLENGLYEPLLVHQVPISPVSSCTFRLLHCCLPFSLSGVDHVG